MTILSNASQEEIDPPNVFDTLLICRAFAYQVLHGAVEQVDLLGWDVDMRKELGEPTSVSEGW